MGNKTSKTTEISKSKSNTDIDTRELFINEILMNINLVISPKQITYLKLKVKDAECYFYTQFDCFVYYNTQIFYEHINTLNEILAKKVGKCMSNKYFKILIEFDSANFKKDEEVDFDPLFMIILEKYEMKIIHYFDLSLLNIDNIQEFYFQLINSVDSSRINRKFDALYFLLPNAEYFCKIDFSIIYIMNEELKFFSMIKELKNIHDINRMKTIIQSKAKIMAVSINKEGCKFSNIVDSKDYKNKLESKEDKQGKVKKNKKHKEKDKDKDITEKTEKTQAIESIDKVDTDKNGKQMTQPGAFTQKFMIDKGLKHQVKNQTDNHNSKINKSDSYKPDFNLKKTRRSSKELYDIKNILESNHLNSNLEISQTILEAISNNHKNDQSSQFVSKQEKEMNVMKENEVITLKYIEEPKINKEPNLYKIFGSQQTFSDLKEAFSKLRNPMDLFNPYTQIVFSEKLNFDLILNCKYHNHFILDNFKQFIMKNSPSSIKFISNFKFCKINNSSEFIKKNQEELNMMSFLVNLIPNITIFVLNLTRIELKAIEYYKDLLEFIAKEMILNIFGINSLNIKFIINKHKQEHHKEILMIISTIVSNFKSFLINGDFNMHSIKFFNFETVLYEKSETETVDLDYERITYMVRKKNNNNRTLLLKKLEKSKENTSITDNILELFGEVITFKYQYNISSMSYGEFAKFCS